VTKEEKKLEILRAAGRVFFRHGFERSKMDDVAKEAGIGKGTVYEYFTSKEQLFEETVAYNYRILLEGLKKAIVPGENIREKLTAFARFVVEMFREYSRIFGLTANSSILARELGAIMIEFNLRVQDILSGEIKEAVSRGEVRADLDPELISSIVMGSVHQYCSRQVRICKKTAYEKHNGPIIDDNGIIDYDQMIDAIMRGVGA